MKIDLHTHCQPASRCAHHQPEELPAFFKSKGIDAIVLTNHYYPFHCDDLAPTLPEQARVYLDIFHRCKASGEKIGIKVFFGAEIKLMNEPYMPEYLLYGLSEEDFLSSFPLYDRSLKELFAFCNERDILLVQAHPYRTKQHYTSDDLEYVHGLEVLNTHPHCDPRFEDTVRLAKRYGKFMTAASDFHHYTQAGSGGMIVPDHINDQFALRDHIRSGKVCIFDSTGVLLEE